MPEFTREISDPNVRTFVQQGVRDTSTAQLIESLGGIAKEMATGAVVSGFTGGAKSIDEVAPSALPEVVGTDEERVAQRVAQIEGLDTLSKITAARKGGLRGDVAKARAGVALRKAISDNPMFAPEIRQAFSGFFRSAADTQFFVDPKKQKTQQEIIQEKIQAEIYEIHAREGISIEDAQNKWRMAQRNEARLSELKLQKSLSEDNISTLTSLTFNQMSLSSARDMMELARASEGGLLKPEDMAAFKLKTKSEVDHARANWLKEVTEKTGLKPTQAQIDAFDKDAEQYVKNREAALDDVDLQKFIAANTEMVSNLIDLDAKTTFTTLAKIKAAGGEGAVSKYLEAVQNPDYRAYLQKSQPEMWRIVTAAQSPVEGVNKVANGVLKFLLSEPGSAEEKENAGSAGGAAPMLKDPGTIGLIRDKLSTIVTSTPASLVLLDSPKWRNAIDQGYIIERGVRGTGAGKKREVGIDIVETSMLSALKRRMGDYYNENGRVLEDLVIKERVNLRRGGRSLEITNENGDLVSHEFYSTILDAIRVSERFPELWEGKFESPEEYVKSILVPEAPVSTELTKEEQEVEAPKVIDSQALRSKMDEGDTEGVAKMLIDQGFTPEDAEELSGLKVRPLQEAQQRELQIRQAMKEHGLTREEVEEALDGVKR